MKRSSVETGVGIFVLVGILAVGYLTIRLGNIELFGERSYTVEARFLSASGLRPGTVVEMAGVQIGQVVSISLDHQRKVAVVRMRIKNEVRLSEDVIASVKTAGLIGDRFIRLTPGGSEAMLEPGGMITETESAIDFEELLSKYIFGNV
jgi:phospholipid/cholesterol/gamma-HCH transport system substrate-binding protein